MVLFGSKKSSADLVFTNWPLRGELGEKLLFASRRWVVALMEPAMPFNPMILTGRAVSLTLKVVYPLATAHRQKISLKCGRFTFPPLLPLSCYYGLMQSTK